ncbi:hypothetical protein A33Q_0141 [Indibacter alkaliphilus LW1]|uniref:Outer membrane insertion C-terminal signal n=1 Tax=Indibacter alkaliphilus (strain CCUG 57479 / KCTC 22604 / LW1) TaxID=1189612 RepID=S2DMB9_INDAL|nr:hypothetical protein A33Q_0141 [Indibacter alkaliphilus LW1]
MGLYKGGLTNQIGVGTDFEKKYFGELRVIAPDMVNYPSGIEGLFHHNFKQTEWYNLHVGLMLGLHRFEQAKAGIPLGFSFKPISGHRHFIILAETTPYFLASPGELFLRANIGLRYNFGKD